MNRFFNSAKKRVANYTILICIAALAYGCFLSHRKNPSDVIKHDAVEYYIYLPAFFIYNDLTNLDFKDKLTEKEAVDFYWVLTNDQGKKHVKYTMGVAMLYSPFFLLSHSYAKISNKYSANGFSTPYHIGIIVSGLFFLTIGLFNLKRFLLNYFNEYVVAITLFLIVIGTNLFNYASFEIGMSHLYTFSLLAIMLNYFKRWLTVNKTWQLYLVGIVFGLIVLIRPINILFILFFLLFEVDSFSAFKQRFSLIAKKKMDFLVSALLAFSIFIPQLIYWKLATGDWFYYSYGSTESFYFDDPKIIEGLISYRKGWFIYTPIMLAVVIAYFIKSKLLNHFKVNVLVLIIPYFYISFSWWCWWYGGSFGMRPLIDLYPIFSILLAIFVSKILQANKWNKLIALPLLVFLVYLNLFQIQKYQKGFLHHDSMTERSYWNYFLTNHTNGNYWECLNSPDYEAAKIGDRDL